MKSAGLLTIDLTAIRTNYNIIKNRLKDGAHMGAAVKANAYGLGLKPVVEALAEQGCQNFFVANHDEALTAQDAAPDALIYVLNGCDPKLASDNIIPVLNSLNDIKAHQGSTALHFDTGMNRLGINEGDRNIILSDLSMLEHLDIKIVMSHFSCADQKDHPSTQRQFEVFQNIAKYFPDAKKSLCNSSGAFRNDDYHFDLIRSGMALYGLNPIPESCSPVQPVVTLEVPVLDIHERKAGEAAGYGETYRFEKSQLCASVALGYGDGFNYLLGNKGALYWRGHRCPIRGRISMDLTIIDISKLPEGERPQVGDMIEVIGDHQSPAMIAGDASTLDYEILTSLGSRYQRRHIYD